MAIKDNKKRTRAEKLPRKRCRPYRDGKPGRPCAELAAILKAPSRHPKYFVPWIEAKYEDGHFVDYRFGYVLRLMPAGEQRGHISITRPQDEKEAATFKKAGMIVAEPQCPFCGVKFARLLHVPYKRGPIKISSARERRA